MAGAQGEFGELGAGGRGQHQVVPADAGLDAAGEPLQARAVLGADRRPQVLRGDGPGPEDGQPGGDGRGPAQLSGVEPVGGGRLDQRVVGGGVRGGQTDRTTRVGECPPPLPRHAVGAGRRDRDGHRALRGPQRVPVLLPVRDEGCRAERRAQGPQQPGPLGAFGGERFERAEDHPGPAEAGFHRQRPYERRWFGGRGERGDVDDERAPAGGAQGLDRESVGVAAPVEQVDQAAAGAEGGRDPGDLGPFVRLRGAGVLADDAAQPAVGLVVAEEIRGDPVGYAQQAREQRPFGVGDLQQAARDERGGRREPEAPGAGGGEPAEFQGQADGGAAAGEVVVEVAVQPLEPGVDVRGEGDQQEVDVRRGEAEASGQLTDSAAAFRAGRFPGRFPVPVRRYGRERVAGLQDAVRGLGGEVLPPVGVVGVRVDGPAGGDGFPDALLDLAEPLPERLHVGQFTCLLSLLYCRGHRAAFPRLRRPGGSRRSRGAAKPCPPGSVAPS